MTPTRLTFETIGNATLLVREDGRPVLATDPWLVGTAYFGSWALDHDLTPEQIQAVAASPFVWISHGHPDHLHPESLELLSREQKVLVPGHYAAEIKRYLEGLGFAVTVLRFKRWFPLTEKIRVMCLENINQDAILLVEAGDALIVNHNDSSVYGEEPFLTALLRLYRKTYLLQLCSADADMLNFVDAHGRRTIPSPDEAKPPRIQATTDYCTRLGVQNFCCFSSQHRYVRADSAWANPYRISFADMRAHWRSPARLIEPWVTVDLLDGSVTRNHDGSAGKAPETALTTAADDWDEKMGPEDWPRVETFARKFKTLRRHIDWIRFTVAGDTRTFWLSRKPVPSTAKERGVHFHVPRRSLMDTVAGGYFDDLLIGNFMKTQLVNVTLYPHFTPLIAKFGGNAKVFTNFQLLRCRLHYFRLSPAACTRYEARRRWQRRLRPALRSLLVASRLLDPAKALRGYLRRLVSL